MKFLIYFGLILMIIGTFRALLVKNFPSRLHYISLSDTAGSALILIALTITGPFSLKIFIALIFLIIWMPYITHIFIKAYLSKQVKKR